MFKKITKAWCIGFPSAIIASGLMAALYFYFIGSKIEYAIVSLGFCAVAGNYLIEYLWREKTLKACEEMSYENYKAKHPNNVRGNRITCFHCGGDRIHFRALMKRIYHREHICVQCGKTLYYSPEQH